MSDRNLPGIFRIFFRTAKLPPESLRRLADENLRRLVDHAWTHVPLYRELWRAHGVHPSDIGGCADLPALPMLDKDVVVEAGDDAIDQRKRHLPLDTMSTSGTSGRAITCRRTMPEMRVARRSYLRTLIYGGARPWRHTLTLASTWLKSKRGAIMKVIARARHILPTDDLDSQIRAIEDFRATQIIGQTGGLYLLAREIARRGRQFPMRFVGPTGATLMPAMRQAMRDAFASEPRDLYGAVELGTISWQCRRGNYHLDADRMHVEIVDEAGRPVPVGATGQVVCTHLYGYTMPLIRYRLLDVASMTRERCSCGVTFPVLGPVQGRINDFLPTPRGDLVSPHYLYHIFDHAGGSPVKEWRIIQHAPGDLTYEYVPEDDFNPGVLEMGMEAIRSRFGPGTNVKAVRVDSVPMTPNGKRTCIVSKLRPEDHSGMRPWDREAAAGMSEELRDELASPI